MRPGGSVQGLAGLRGGEGLVERGEQAGRFLVGARSEHDQVGDAQEQADAGGGGQRPGVEAEGAEPFCVRCRDGSAARASRTDWTPLAIFGGSCAAGLPAGGPSSFAVPA